MYEDKYNLIKDLSGLKINIRDNLKIGRLYLDKKIIVYIEEYLDLYNFTYSSDGVGGMLFNDYYYKFFMNLMDKNIEIKSDYLKKKIMNKIRRLIP
jgi:hypothetical protein